MARRPLSSFATLWSRHVLNYSEIFTLALQELSESATISGDEDAISERLCPFLSKACFNLRKTKKLELQTPYWESPIQPVNQEELKGGKKRRRPDFTCRLINKWANSHEESEISLHIECKLLGNPTSATWILNENYVKNGIKRFDSKDYQYGKNAYSGIMIGYIISMNPTDIASEVNTYQSKHLPEYNQIQFLFDTVTLFNAHQSIKRKNITPFGFELIHLWVDLKNCYVANKKVGEKTKKMSDH